MKKLFRLSGAGLLLCLLGSFVYFLQVLHSDGSKNIRFIEPLKEYETFQELINHPELKNKVIYVDFWHTGCRPCLIEFQSLPAMKARLKNAPIAYLYLGKDRSVPGERFRWKKMILNKELAGYHYFITDAQFDTFWDATVKSVKQKSFPHHLIINKTGQVLEDNAPGPGSEKIIALLQAALDNR